METLRLVDVADDGQLVLMSNDGRRFVLPVDAEVRAAVRRDRARPVDDDRVDRPGPREVQARIRAGADAEEVAAATGLDVEYVRRFEGPVLAERRHVADLGRALPVHRDPGARPSSLETVVVAALTDAGHDADRIRWDSRRAEGTRWDVEVVADLPDTHEDGSGGGSTREPDEARAVRATWRIDVATRAIEELDDTARRLTALDRRRLSPVRDRVFDIEAGRSRRQQQAGGDVTASTTASILEALALQRGRRPGEARGDAPDRGAPPGHAATAAAPRHDHYDHPHEDHHDHVEGDDHADRHDDDHRDDRSPARDGRGARIAAFAPRRPPAGPAADVTPDESQPVGARDAVPGTAADLPPDPGTGDGAADFHEEFPLAPEPPVTEPPAIEPSLLGDLDLDAPPRSSVPPVRRNGTPGPRTVASPSTPRRVGTEDPRPEVGAPQRGAAAGEVSATGAETETPAARRAPRRRRAAVPSWDDIVFGARVDDD